MVLKRVLDNSTMLYISKSTIDAIGYIGVQHIYLNDVPEETEVRGLNLSPYGCPSPIKTKYGDMVAIEFMTTEDVFKGIDDAESL